MVCARTPWALVDVVLGLSCTRAVRVVLMQLVGFGAGVGMHSSSPCWHHSALPITVCRSMKCIVQGTVQLLLVFFFLAFGPVGTRETCIGPCVFYSRVHAYLTNTHHQHNHQYNPFRNGVL